MPNITGRRYQFDIWHWRRHQFFAVHKRPGECANTKMGDVPNWIGVLALKTEQIVYLLAVRPGAISRSLKNPA